MDRNGQIYFDNEENIPEADKKRLQEAQQKEVADALHKLHLREVEQRYEEWLEQPYTGEEF